LEKKGGIAKAKMPFFGASPLFKSKTFWNVAKIISKILKKMKKFLSPPFHFYLR